MVLQCRSNKVFPAEQLDAVSAPVTRASTACLPDANRVVNGFYIGDFQLALDVLRKDDHMGVTHILSLFTSSILSSFCDSCRCSPIFVACNQTASPEDRCQEARIPTQFKTEKCGAHLHRMVVPLKDTPDENILRVLRPCFEFIDEGRQRGTVLVHCMAGRSRSAAIVIAYLMRTFGLSLKEAMASLNRKYKKACPNVGYLRELEQFEMQLQKLQ